MTAIYRWQGEIRCDAEIPMLLKTTAGAAPRLRDLVLARHPYDSPCVVAWPCEPGGSSPAFLAWIAAQTA